MKALPDIELVQAAHQGDANAFTEIVTRHSGRVQAVIRGLLGSGPDLDDTVQETFIRLFRSLSRFRGEASLGTYLTRIAVNQSLTVLEQRKSRSLLSLDEAGPAIWTTLDDDLAQQMEAREVVERALAALAPEFRAVAVLRLLEGYSTKETAEILQVPAGTVLSRLSRAQEKLKEMLKHVQT